MRVVFFGTPQFASILLDYLIQKTKHEVVAVVSKPDAHKGRGQHVQPTPVKHVVERLERKIPVIQPVKASCPEMVEELKKYSAEIFLVVAYGEILKSEIINIPTKGCFNIHASLLPMYRGAAPIQRALMDGCHKTGVTFMKMGKGMDSGDIVMQKSCQVGENENMGDVSKKLLQLSIDIMVEALDLIEAGKATFSPQQHAEATYAPKIQPEDLILNPADDVWLIHNKVRALSPTPGAFFWIELRGEKKRLKVLRTHIDTSLCDTVYRWQKNSDESLMLSGADGSIIFDEVQLEGRAAMPSREFLRGYTLDEILFL